MTEKDTISTPGDATEDDFVPPVAAVRRSMLWMLRPGAAALLVLGALVVVGILEHRDEPKRTAVPDGPDLGKSFTLDASGARPEITGRVDGFTVTTSATAGVQVEKGQHLVAVRLALKNNGTSAWAGALKQTVLVDEQDRSYHPDPRFPAVHEGAAWPARFRIAGGHTRVALVVFAVPSADNPERFELRLGPGPKDAATWDLVSDG